jgi:energy-coupling factor transport system ATP-binding protein
VLNVKNFTFRYTAESGFLWNPLNFSVRAGEIILLRGKNGSGKTTLLQCLCSIIPQAIEGELRGEISFRGSPVTSRPLREIAPEINILFQEPDKQVFMPTVEEEIAFGPENLCVERGEIERRLNEILERLKITELRRRLTAELSFGQKKLVVLASILAMTPAIILLDELSAGIEEGLIESIGSYLVELKEIGRSFVLSEHHPAFAELADQIIDLDEMATPGRLAEPWNNPGA